MWVWLEDVCLNEELIWKRKREKNFQAWKAANTGHISTCSIAVDKYSYCINFSTVQTFWILYAVKYDLNIII